MENANFSLIALNANVPPSPANHRAKPRLLNARVRTDQMTRDNITTIHHVSFTLHWWENFIAQLVKVQKYQDWCFSGILALSGLRTWPRWWRILSVQTGSAEVCKYICWQAGRNEGFDWTNISWFFTFHRIYKYRLIHLDHLT